MDFEALILLLMIGGLLVVSPILAIVALVRVVRLERRLERLAAGSTAPPAPAPPRPTPSAPSGPAAAATPSPAAAPGVPTAAAVPPSATTPPAAAASADANGFDLESMIAGRWLNRVGIVALLLAVGFFLKFAFDNDWIGPTGRVAIGLACGSALLVYSQWLLGRGYRYFSEGIAAAGAGSLYLSLYAAWGFYELIPQGVAFAGMALVTLALVALAVGRDTERLALLALLGGLMTPGVLSTGQDQQIVLFTYLAVLNGGLLPLARARSWRTLEPVALVGTVLYFAGWYDAFYEPRKLLATLLYATVFFTEFATLPLLRARRERSLLPEQYALVLANVTWFLVALHAMLYDDHRWGLTVAVLALAAAHLAMVRALPAPDRASPVRQLYAGLALTLVTVTVPIRLEGEWITMAWAIEGAVVVWSGFRLRAALMRGAGLVLFGLVLLLLLVDDIAASRVLLNARFATFLVAIVAFAAAVVLARRHDPTLTRGERVAFVVVVVAINVLALGALSMEVWDFFALVRTGVDLHLGRQVGLSVLWTLYATGLIVAGVRRESPVLRWQGLTLLILVVAKVFVFDLSFLERAYRILSFFALGLFLLVVSFLYQRRLFGSTSRT